MSPIDVLRAKMPKEPLVLFLIDAVRQTGAWRNEGAGLPDGAPLYSLFRPMGMVVEDRDHGVVHPLVDPGEWVLHDQPDLDAAVGVIRRAAGTVVPDDSQSPSVLEP